VGSYAFEFKSKLSYRLSFLFLLLSDKIKKNGSIFYTTFQRVRTILFISFFYILLLSEIYKDFYDENDGINGNKEISFDCSKKKRSFDIIVIMDI
jgi:hypothetical protein